MRPDNLQLPTTSATAAGSGAPTPAPGHDLSSFTVPLAGGEAQPRVGHRALSTVPHGLPRTLADSRAAREFVSAVM